jgi:hypothetical protein
VQGVYKHRDPPQRNAASDDPLAQLGQYSCGNGADRAPSISQSTIALISGAGIEARLIVSTSWLIFPDISRIPGLLSAILRLIEAHPNGSYTTG